jgi:hypothetical protein
MKLIVDFLNWLDARRQRKKLLKKQEVLCKRRNECELTVASKKAWYEERSTWGIADSKGNHKTTRQIEMECDVLASIASHEKEIQIIDRDLSEVDLKIADANMNYEKAYALLNKS